jgi:heme-degrading monooxygenase HmoA
MILEIAILDVKPELVERMEELGREVAEYLGQGTTPGFHSFRWLRAIEDPNRFVIHIVWDRVEDHTALGESEFGKRVSEVLADAFASDPVVHHYRVVEGAATGAVPL